MKKKEKINSPFRSSWELKFKISPSLKVAFLISEAFRMLNFQCAFFWKKFQSAFWITEQAFGELQILPYRNSSNSSNAIGRCDLFIKKVIHLKAK